ncbi:MAG: sugar ABC transporter permease [Negativicutes bacterium]|jgi:raffinose/stachyose/melibiose transport system permease protein
MAVFVPFIFGIWYSFTNWNGIDTPAFIGLTNYTHLFHDSQFWLSLLFTAKFALISIVSINIIGLALALVVTQKIKTSSFLRTIFFMPNLIGGLILGFIWQFIFIKAFGAVGDLVGASILKDWLATTETGFWGLVILMSWQMAGYIMIIYIAHLEALDYELLEAAAIDGAGVWQKLRHIVFPLIVPAFTVSVFMTLSGSFKLYDQNLSLTAGGPYNSTQMVAMNIYNTAFGENMMAYAQSKAIIFFIIVTIMSLVQVYVGKKQEVEA